MWEYRDLSRANYSAHENAHRDPYDPPPASHAYNSYPVDYDDSTYTSATSFFFLMCDA